MKVDLNTKTFLFSLYVLIFTSYFSRLFPLQESEEETHLLSETAHVEDERGEEQNSEGSEVSSLSFTELDHIVNADQFQILQQGHNEDTDSDISLSGDDGSSANSNNQEDSASDHENIEVNASDPPEPFYADVFEILKKKIRSKFSEVIDTPPQISAAELLLNALTLIRTYNFNFSQFEGLMKLLNTIFKTSVVPDTRYKLDILLKSLAGMHYHFVCKYCVDYMGEFDYRSVREVVCKSCKRANSLSNLNNCLFFVMFDLPPQIEVLLSNDIILQKLKRPTELVNNEEPRILRDVYDGKMYQQFILTLDDNPNIHHISFCFGVDGVSLYTSSNTNVWPIFCCILELPPYERAHNLLLAGLWFGKEHVALDVFLKPFADHCKKLSTDGFKINLMNVEILMKGHVLCCCADAPARAGVQCIQQHGGAFSCNWCLHPSPGRLYRPLEELQRRTRAEIIADGTAALALMENVPNFHVNGVKGISPVLTLSSMDIIDGMILEYFHAAAHGVAKTFLNGWLGEDGCDQPFYIGTPTNLEKIDGLLKHIKLPVEARKPTRLLSQLGVWKGRDYENFILYLSPVLQNILPLRYLNHWNLFVQGIHLLLQQELPEINIRKAQELLQRFGRQTEQLYPERYLLYNVHIICEHLAENCDNWGPCWSINGYCFEDGNRILKNK
ncbi:1-(5-phosphoribosyl)-5-[(5-phosphoribosylamino)methylideneamino] imidazole-4-carboxamide isomerase, partial [Frankliniella fusca]